VTEAHGAAAGPAASPGGIAPRDAWSPGAAPGVYCPFLASIDLDDRVRQARLVPDTANRCLSTGEPVAASGRDQRLFCLTADHPECARFVRATQASRDREPEVGQVARRRLSGPIMAAVGVLVLAAALAGISLAANGDLSIATMPGSPSPAAPAGSGSAAIPGAADASPVPIVTPGAVALPSADASGTRTPAGPASAAPGATAAVAAATSAPATPTPTPKPRKYPGLTACPGTPDCYIYVVKAGDALGAIADRYGLGLDEVLARNPSIRDPGLIVRGQRIKLPTPKD
jgi:hypothetical protein